MRRVLARVDFSAPASRYTICPCTSTELRVLEPLVRRTVTDSDEDLQSIPWSEAP